MATLDHHAGAQLHHGDAVNRLSAALTNVVMAAGGHRRVGYELWPHLGPKRAEWRPRHCLNPARRDKLALHEYVVLLRRGRELGVHDAMEVLCEETGLQPPMPNRFSHFGRDS